MVWEGVSVLSTRTRLAPLFGVLSAALLLCCVSASYAANAPAHDFATYRPSAQIVRIEPADAPVIDGDLSDAVWAKALVLDEFYQLDPDTGQPGSEKTVLRIMYDENNIYFGIYAYDSEPDGIAASIKTRDGDIFADDSIRIYLDPNLTRRDAYMFEFNALGARLDGIAQNNSTFFLDWNTIWSAKSRRVADGWVSEVSIPFRGLSYSRDQTAWGFDFQRGIRRKGERIRWSSITTALVYLDVSRAGTLTGISNLNEGIADLQLYERLTYEHDWQATDSSALLGTVSGNAYYRINPGLTASLTFNPDFADTPLDERLVNLSRFALFQPETRDFFLQDVATFEYAGRGFIKDNNARPFFSRNIGLANGRAVSIVTGAKLSGTYDGFGIGALSVLTSGTGLNKRGQVLSVARITRQVLDESQVGLMFTNGDPNGTSTNTVGGVDFQFRDLKFASGDIMRSDFFYQRSASNVLGDDDSFGVGFEYPNEPLGGNFLFKQVGQNFFPALGFVNRSGIRYYQGEFIYRDRTLGWRWFDAGSSAIFVTRLDNHLESRENKFWVGINANSLDQFYVNVFNYYEDVPVAFNLPGSVAVPRGRYNWTILNPRIISDQSRTVSFQLDLFCCHFYNGNYVRTDLLLNWKLNDTVLLTPRYAFTRIDLPTGSVDVHVASADIVVAFTPDMDLITQLQFDNISQAFSLNARYRWEYEPGQEIFASFGQAALIPGTTFQAQTSQFNLRLGQTFRF